MSNIGSNAGSGLRGGVHSVHGSNDSAAQNQIIADRGVDEFQTGSRTHNPGSSFDKHPSDVRSAGLGGNPATENWGSNTASTTGTYGHPSSTNAGPHGSNVANTADPRVDSDLSNRGTTGTYGHSSTNAGPHSSNVANTADPRIDSDLSDRGHTGTHGTGNATHGTYTPTGAYGNPSSTNAGPHGSNVLNKADPRIDSDRDNRGLTGNQTGAAAGPHSSNLANKADPRVDSDRDNRGAHPTGSEFSSGAYHTGPSKEGKTRGDPTGISRPSNAGLPTREDKNGVLRDVDGDTTSSTNAGPHGSNAANKADPRIDSDRDNRGLTGTSTGAAAGPHSSGAANKADPRVDSDRDNRAAGLHGVTPGSYGSEGLETDTSSKHQRPESGDAAATREHEGKTTHVKEGSHPPHKSNILNKLDPRVKTTTSTS